MSRLTAFAFGLFLCGVASAQVQQSGTVTIDHGVAWLYNGVIGDAGPATNGILSGVGVTANSLTGLCQNTHVTTQAYVEFCFGVTDSQAQISLQGYGEATPSLYVNIAGTLYPLPPAGGGGAVLTSRQVSSGTTDQVVTGDGAVLWDSASTGAKTETLYGCQAGTKGYSVRIVDEIGSASTYSIGIVPAAGNTILTDGNYYISYNFGSVTFMCDGVSNWVQL